MNKNELMVPDAAIAEILLQADISYGVRGQLNIDLRQNNEPKGEESRKLQMLKIAIADMNDTGEIRPSSEMLIIQEPGPSLRHIVDNITTDPKKTGVHFDKSKGEPGIEALRLVDAIEMIKASKPRQAPSVSL